MPDVRNEETSDSLLPDNISVIYSFLLSGLLLFCVLFPHDVGTRLRLGYEPYAETNQYDGQSLARLEHADAREYAHRNRHERLHIVVYAHHGGAQRVLSYHHQDVAYVCAEEHHEARFEPCACRHSRKVDACHVVERERQDKYRGIGEHPFVHGYHRVALYQLAEERQVERKRQLRAEAEQVAADVAHLGACRSRTRNYQYHGARASEHHAQGLLARYGFFKYYCCQNHREDRHRRRDDARVDGRCYAQAYRVAALVGHKAEYGSSYKHEQVFARNVFLWREQRCQPEQDGSSCYPECHHVYARYAVRHGIFAERSHQTPERTCEEQAEVSN